MPSRSPRKGKPRYSDPSNASLTPFHESFGRTWTGSRPHSLSPRKREPKQPLHIRMNLTEGQMDKITDAFTKRVDGGSAGAQTSTGGSPSKNATRLQGPSPSKHRNRYSLETSGSGDHHPQLGRFSGSRARSQDDRSSHSLAERRKRETPAPIQVGEGRRLARTTPQRVRMETVPDIVSPLSPREMYEASGVRDSYYSGYTSEYPPSQQLEPVNVRHGSYEDMKDGKIGLGAYREWVDGQKVNASWYTPESPAKPSRRTKSTAEGLRSRAELASPIVTTRSRKDNVDTEAPLFSPFPFYFRGKDFPSEKRGQKTMIGENGWLERTDVSADKVNKGNAKKMGILDGIKKIAKDMTELHHPHRRSQQAANELLATRMAISLDAREQSLLYGELEFHLSNALNTYITVQLEKGRLVTDKLKKIGDAWLQKGRPRVVGFRYDLETQLELVSLHADEFVFLGRRQGNPVEIAGLLHAMKVNARAMRIRTFCQADSAIAKQLVDAQSLFNMLGVARADDLALAEIAQFFKVCIEREQNDRLREAKTARMSRAVDHRHHHGGEQPGRQGSGDDDDEWLFYPN